MNFFFISFLFILSKILDFIIVFFAKRFIPYLGYFSHPGTLLNYHLHPLVTAWANFDGVFYLRIAKNGYSQFEQAFFPLYPLLMKTLSPFFLANSLLIGLFISNIAFLLGLFFLTKYLGSDKSFWPILILFVFPTSFFFGAVYTEGLFFLLVILTLYFLKKEKLIAVAVTAYLTSLTKFVGVFLIIPIILKLITQKSKILKSYFHKVLLLSSPILGLLTYCFYLFKTTGDPIFFLNSQPAFGAQRSTNFILLPQVIYRYFKIIATATHNFQYYVAIFEFLIFIFVFVILVLDLIKNLKLKIKNYSYLGLNLFSLFNLLLPTLTGTLSSIPRYALLSLSFFIFLGQMRSVHFKIFIVLIFFLLHILSLGFFIQGYFVG